MARLVPTEINDKNLAQAKGWLAEDDPFFKTMERIVQSRSKHTSRLKTRKFQEMCKIPKLVICTKGKTDQEKFKELGWGLRTWDQWYFARAHLFLIFVT